MKRYRIDSVKKVNLNRFDPDDTGDFADDEAGREEAEQQTAEILSKFADLHTRLYACRDKALLIVLQAMDTGGKDGTIKKVFGGFNPTNCNVSSFKVPTELELAHDFLWRVHQQVPPKGFVGIFNRSHYEDVLVTRVHGMVSKELAKQRFQEIRNFEKMLSDNGVTIVKFFLHISKSEQKERLEERVQKPEKHWKFNLGDLKERNLWDKYQKVFQDAIGATGQSEAPWYIVPANNKWYRDWVVSRIVLKTMEGMKLNYPKPAPGLDFTKIRIR